jgi:trans-aconitate 2-methyltransferase
MPEWNAEQYHELSLPQQQWGRRVLERMPLQGHERILDIGCGTGRITSEIAARAGRGRVIGVDRSAAMLETAAQWLREHGPGVRLIRADGAALPFRSAVDVVFSGATFHWIHDHAALFRSIVTALKPGGRLVAQCGGSGNLGVLLGRAERLMGDPRFAGWFADWSEPTFYPDVASTKHRLAAAGFTDVEVWLEAAPTHFGGPDEFQQFIATVCVRHHLNRLPGRERDIFLRELTAAAAADSPPFTLDYWRLNIAAMRPA